MKARIEIDLGNDAFNEKKGTDDGATEAARILHKLADDLDKTESISNRTLLDVNGNIVGFWEVRHEW